MDCGTPGADAAAPRAVLLRHHLIAIAEAVTRTRREIAGLHRDQETGRARDELYAVVQGAEQATNTILTAAETVDALARRIAGRAQDDATRTEAAAIQAEMQAVFEACNFQDLTGQRISKVVRTIVLVEERIAAMLRLWSGPAETPAPSRPARAERGAEAALLNGPVLPGDACVSQNAVDSLFA
ncbi:chemotaxis protein CheZ [Methylobacterium platani]|uniref:Chemotaxis protein CheZ n=2 Tax=Methylobacterium platani TaxID=427683 RepID=A0A179S113_9HYPH|nr:chemotaxis protein CheZ [Methylobacterium platani]